MIQSGLSVMVGGLLVIRGMDYCNNPCGERRCRLSGRGLLLVGGARVMWKGSRLGGFRVISGSD